MEHLSIRVPPVNLQLITKNVLQEKAYNPYYALVGQRLLATSHAHRITARYNLWDFLRSIGETSIGQRGDDEFDSSTSTVSASRTRNMAKFYAWLIARGSFSIAGLQVCGVPFLPLLTSRAIL